MANNPTDDAWADALQQNSGGGDEWASAMSKQGGADKAGGHGAEMAASVAEFGEFGEGPTQQVGTQNLEFLLDLPLEVMVELGRSKMIIHRLLQMTQGSVIELDKAAGGMVEIYVNNKLLGKGEVIVVNDRFGVRITEIISQADRIKNIG